VLVLWGAGGSCCPGVFVFFPEWLSFVFGVCLLALWDPGTSAHVEVSICFFVWVFCPSVVSLSFLVAVVGNCPLLLVAAVGVSLLAPCGFCPPWGVSALAVGVGVFVDWCSGAWPALGCLLSFGGCGWRLSFGALGLLPALWCSSSSHGWLWFGVSVCLSALWGFRPVWGVYLPFSCCGWRAWASACFAVFFFPFGCCGGHLSFVGPVRLLGPFFPSLVWAT